MVSINWSDQSIQDLICIADFIARDSKHYAKRLDSEELKKQAD